MSGFIAHPLNILQICEARVKSIVSTGFESTGNRTREVFEMRVAYLWGFEPAQSVYFIKEESRSACQCSLFLKPRSVKHKLRYYDGK